MKTHPDPCNNLLLGLLKENELNKLIPHLESITVSRAEVLFNVGEELQYIYFPTTAIISLLHRLTNGLAVELAMVGKEGMLGVTELIGENTSSTQAIVIQAGHAYRISTVSLKTILASKWEQCSGTLQEILLRYAKMLFIQMSQSSACNRRHTVDQQLPSWLLSGFDRSETNTLSMTHATISYCLGVRREGVSEAAKKLQDAGIIKYKRGIIELTNRPALEIMACECYKVIKSKLTSLVGDLQAD